MTLYKKIKKVKDTATKTIAEMIKSKEDSILGYYKPSGYDVTTEEITFMQNLVRPIYAADLTQRTENTSPEELASMSQAQKKVIIHYMKRADVLLNIENSEAIVNNIEDVEEFINTSRLKVLSTFEKRKKAVMFKNEPSKPFGCMVAFVKDDQIHIGYSVHTPRLINGTLDHPFIKSIGRNTAILRGIVDTLIIANNKVINSAGKELPIAVTDFNIFLEKAVRRFELSFKNVAMANIPPKTMST